MVDFSAKKATNRGFNQKKNTKIKEKSLSRDAMDFDSPNWT